MIEGSNQGWNVHGFDTDPLLRQGGRATKTTGDHTTTTYIDHRTIHFGEEIPNRTNPHDWKLTIYMLFV